MTSTSIKKIKVDDLIPYANNSRLHSDEQVLQIASSIKEFGFLNPIIIDGDNGIIAGHGRVMAAKKLGIDELPCVDASHLTPAQKKAYVIADNKIALNSEWDVDALRVEFEALREMDFDIELTGFSLDEISELEIEEIAPEYEEDADGEIGEPPEEPKTKEGDVWILGKHRLMCGDSTSIDAVEKLLENKKANLVFTDPPYGVSYTGGHNEKKRTGIIADTLEDDALTGLFYGALLSAIPNTEDNAPFYVWYADRKSVETFAALSQLPLKLRAVIAWYKVKSGLGAFMSQYIPNHEPCMYLHKDGCSPAWYGPSDEKTVWELKKESRNEFHPTQKPVELPERAINNSSKTGDIVLDLFGGSGSTLIACEKTNRKAYLMELDPKYCDVIINRWQTLTGKEATLESTGETFDSMVTA